MTKEEKKDQVNMEEGGGGFTNLDDVSIDASLTTCTESYQPLQPRHRDPGPRSCPVCGCLSLFIRR